MQLSACQDLKRPALRTASRDRETGTRCYPLGGFYGATAKYYHPLQKIPPFRNNRN